MSETALLVWALALDLSCAFMALKYTIGDYRSLREAKCCGGLGAGNQRDLDNGVRGNSFQVKSEPFEEHRQKLLSVIFESVYNSSNGKFKSTFPAEAMTNGGHPPRTDAH